MVLNKPKIFLSSQRITERSITIWLFWCSELFKTLIKEWWIDSPSWTFCFIIPRLLKQTFIINSWRRSSVLRTLSLNFHIIFWSNSLTYTQKKTKIIWVSPLGHSHSDFSMKINSNDDWWMVDWCYRNHSFYDGTLNNIDILFFFHFHICIVFPVLNAFDLIFLTLFFSEVLLREWPCEVFKNFSKRFKFDLMSKYFLTFSIERIRYSKTLMIEF